MTFTTEQLERLADYLQEVRDCKDVASEWSETEWCDYNNEWIDPENNFAGYVKNGGDRPVRPHP